MMPKQIPTIANDKGMQDDAMLYALNAMQCLRVENVRIAIENAYKRGAVSAFATGYRCGYIAVEPEYKDSINLYKKQFDTFAAEAYENALKRGKITLADTHEEIVAGIAEELAEFRDATDSPSEHIPEYTQRQEELADVLICCLTELHREGVSVRKIVSEKIKFNNKRT